MSHRPVRRSIRGFAVVGTLLLGVALSLRVACAAGNPQQGPNIIRNPSFEEPDPAVGDMPAHWRCGKIYGAGPTHFEWSADAHTGERSLRMTSLHVTQLVYQDLKLPAGSHYTFRIRARGSGKLRLFVQARRQSEVLGDTALTDWTLTDRWLDYEITGTVPQGCEHVRFHVGTPMRGCDVFLDDAEVLLGQSEAAPSEPPGSGAGDTADLLDITPFCQLKYVPFAGTALAELSDGEVRWGGLRPEHRPGRGARFEFHFPCPTTVEAIELAQSERRPATSYLIDADTDGDGSFDKTLVRVTGVGQGGELTRHSLEPTQARALRFCGLQGPDRYGRSYPGLREFRILVQPSASVTAVIQESVGPTAHPKAAAEGSLELRPVGVPRALPQVSRDLSLPMTERTARGVFIEAWMLGLGKETPPLFDRLEPLEHFLWQLDYVGADHVWLFPRRTGTRSPIWPSEFVEGSEWDALSPLVETLRERQIRTFVIFGKTSKLLQPELSWPKWFGGLLAEVASKGTHGASICADEYPQCGGGPDPEVYAAALERELGLAERPAVREDTEEYRRWMLFHYQQVAIAHKQAAERALAVNPDFSFVSNWRVDPVLLNQTYGVLAYDVLGQRAGLDYFGTDPYYGEPGRRTYMERTVKLLAAAARPQGALPVLKGGSWDFEHLDRYPGILLNGSAIASVMHGAAGASFYRLNYLFLNNKSHLVREAFRIIEWLDAAGLRATHAPPTIAVLHSRASEDFWQLRHELTRGADLRVDGIRGYVAQKIIEEFLIRNNYPFEIHYLDREDDLAELGQYRMIVLPFPYCISDKALSAVAEAYRAGARVVICERLGEANELGTLRPEPAFHAWQERDGVVVLDDVVESFTDPRFRARLAETFDGLLGDGKPLEVWEYGQNVEVVMREGVSGQRLLAAINWEPREVVFDVGLRLPEGAYKVRQCDGYGSRPAAVAGRTELTTAELGRFRVRLSRGQVRVYDVRPVR